jgi:mannitol-1-phosphate/altronate dehydrogenase
MVTLTVTEKGYSADLQTKECRLDPDIPENNWMLSHSAGKRRALEGLGLGTAPHMTPLAYITAAAQNRKTARIAGFSVMSCDNL